VPTKIEKDTVTGRDTTGHEWDGLKELNTPLPKWWAICVLRHRAVVGGVFRAVSVGARDQQAISTACWVIRSATPWTMRCRRWRRSAPAVHGSHQRRCQFADIRKDPELACGCGHCRTHCLRQQLASCHAAGGGGQPAIRHWRWRLIWGGLARCDPADDQPMAIRGSDEKARESQMPRFGTDGVLKPDENPAGR